MNDPAAIGTLASTGAASGLPLLEVNGLTVLLAVNGAKRAVLRDVSLTVRPGETVGLVGESGSGKSMTARAVDRLLPPGAEMHGSIRFGGADVSGLAGADLRRYRSQVAMIFQDPRAHINPVRRVGDFMTEALRTNLGVPRAEARRQAADMLTQVGIEDGARRLGQYPHQMSGGMLQRVMIAAALPLSDETFHQFRTRTGHTILERYGMSETSVLTSNPFHHDRGERIAGTVGVLLPGVSVRAVDDFGAPCPVGKIGHVQVKGPTYFAGHWRLLELSQSEFTEDGWFETGDLGRFGGNSGEKDIPETYLTLVGRSKDLIISGWSQRIPERS